MSIATTDPTTGRVVRTFEAQTDAEIESAIARAADGFRSWRRTRPDVRAAALHRLADLLDAERDALAELMALEMGKLLQAGRDEAAKCAWGCRYYAEHGPAMLVDEPVSAGAARTFVRPQPLGPLLAVMPWNFPLWQVVRFAAPAVMAGNVVLLKHAANVPQCALALEGLFRRAGFPEGTFQVLLVGVEVVPRLIAEARIAGVTLTGSEQAGRRVGALAGEQLKKAVLELGGSDPFIVLPSADLAAAVDVGVRARMINGGQSCIAAKRFIVAGPIADAFERGFCERVSALRVGDPRDPATEVGPLATQKTLDDLDDQVRRSVAAGARVAVGGHRLDRPGSFFAPTVLTDVPADAAAAREELFGPVAVLFRVPDLDAAIRLANDTTFGLGCSVWTRDPDEQARVIDEVETGQVFVNGMVVSDPRLPFGGIKRSGHGRELGPWGLREFVNLKTVWIAASDGGLAARGS